jgi:hypothetical protein
LQVGTGQWILGLDSSFLLIDLIYVTKEMEYKSECFILSVLYRLILRRILRECKLVWNCIGAGLYQDDQKNEDICEVGGMQVNDHPIHRDGMDEIIRESEVHCMEETGNCEENVEVHEEDKETFFSIIESFIPAPANLSKVCKFCSLS